MDFEIFLRSVIINQGSCPYSVQTIGSYREIDFVYCSHPKRKGEKTEEKRKYSTDCSMENCLIYYIMNSEGKVR